MHFTALRSLIQPCMTAYCIHHNTYDPGISPGSASQCIVVDVYLRSSLSRKRMLCDYLRAYAQNFHQFEANLRLVSVPTLANATM